MTSPLESILNSIGKVDTPLAIGTSEFSFSSGSDGDIKISSYFSGGPFFYVKNAQPMELISSIQQAKKAQLKIENWNADQIQACFEKIKNIVTTHSHAIAGIEAHYQGTTRKFQLEWTVEPVLQLIEDLLLKKKMVEGISSKGLIGAITPRFQSFFEIGWRVLYALFHKDALVIKPATATAISALIWNEILKECDLPVGLISFVYGSGSSVGKFLMDHPGVRNVSFSGAYETLRTYPLSLEKKYQFFFNGKNSVCVLGDYDFKKGMKDIVRLFIEHNGKSVFSPARLFILDTIEKEFKSALSDYLNTVPILQSVDDEFGFFPLKSDDQIQLKKFKSEFEAEEGKFIFGNEHFGFYSDLANCSELYRNNLELPIYNLTAVKYAHEMTKWVNNNSFGHSVVIFGSEEKGNKIVLKSEVGKAIFNPSPLRFQKIRPVKLSGFGDVDFNIPNSFYSFVKAEYY